MKLNPQTTAFLFPGQGSQAVGMGAELAAADEHAAGVFERADEVLGYKLSQLMWNGPEDQLNQTENTQPALLVHSVAVMHALEARAPGFRPAMAAGHSLGEFTALVSAGSIEFEQAVRLVRARGEAMRDAVSEQPGGMLAVLGLETAEVEAVCAEVREADNGGVWIANDNCPGQLVLSGAEGSLNKAADKLEQAGARKVVRLAVSIAAHSPYMQAAQARFGDALAETDVADPDYPVVGNVSAAPLTTAAGVRQDLQAQLTANVRWTESIENMIASGADTFVELGSGTVLTGLVRRINRNVDRHNLDDPDSFASLVE